MPKVQRSSDVVEVHGERAFIFGLPGLALMGLGAFLLRYQGESGMFVPLAAIFIALGLGLVGYGLWAAVQIRRVSTIHLQCPYCDARNSLVTNPEEDFRCGECNRMVPVVDGAILPVEQVRCGFCNGLNYFSSKTEVLLCEECNHDIPISGDDDAPRRHSAFAVQADDQSYELVLTAAGPKTEEIVTTLQHMLALNRNQVKGILEATPAVLLTGIPKMKAEMLRAQITMHGGQAEYRPVGSAAAVA